MTATFIQITPEELDRLTRSPALIEALFRLEGGEPEACVTLSNTIVDRLRSVSPTRLAESLAKMDPALKERLAERLGKMPSELAGSLQAGDLSKLIEQRRTSLAGGSQTDRQARPTLSLAKDWHGVHYLLCGEAEPGASLLSQAVLGGTELGDDDEGFSGYGPPRCFTASQVAELAQALSHPGLEAEAAARFDPKRMSDLEIYPGWRASDEGPLLDAVRRFREFYSKAADDGAAIITSLV